LKPESGLDGMLWNETDARPVVTSVKLCCAPVRVLCVPLPRTECREVVIPIDTDVAPFYRAGRPPDGLNLCSNGGQARDKNSAIILLDDEKSLMSLRLPGRNSTKNDGKFRQQFVMRPAVREFLSLARGSYSIGRSN
jgi:hypothetical protein